jgi:hypothetical protein
MGSMFRRSELQGNSRDLPKLGYDFLFTIIDVFDWGKRKLRPAATKIKLSGRLG